MTITRPATREWLLLVAMLVIVWRYFWLMDDAFIYFRYVDNLVFLGRGLVYNPGEYVEGFTSPAWLILLVPFRALGLDYWTIVRFMSLPAALSFGLLCIAINRRLSPPDAPILNLPLALAAGHYGIASYFSSGLEAPLVQVMAAVYAAAALWPASSSLQVLVGSSPLIRPEFALTCLVFGAFRAIRDRRVPWSLVAGAVLSNGTWLLFRVYYYADLMPNTFYLKARMSWGQGLAYLCNSLEPWSLVVPFAVGLGVLAFMMRHHLPSSEGARALMLTCAGVVAVWVVSIGGDMVYFRYMSFPVCLALLASGGIVETAILRVGGRSISPRARDLLVVGAFMAAFVSRPPQLAELPWSLPASHKWSGIEDPMWHRERPDLRASSDRAQSDRELRQHYRLASTAQRLGQHAMAIGWCRNAYFEFDKYVVHTYGLTDALLARVEAPWTRPGHKDVRERAKSLARLEDTYAAHRGRGLYRFAVSQGAAPAFITRNLALVERIERQVYNSHRLLANLRMALRPVYRIPP
ncbi:MAG: hypothetical protein ACHQ53_06605 [Polyangiales bacterium]